jgi:hypothetical protein
MSIAKYFAAVLLLLSLGPILPATAGDGYSTSPVMEIPGSGRVPGPNDQSKLLRNPGWVDVRIETSGLDPATPYTAWAVIFNKPRYCAASPCGAGDLPVSPGHDSRVLGSLAYLSGGFSDNDGKLTLEARLHRPRSGVKPTATAFGPGLLHGDRAEIHVVLRGHGQDAGDPVLAIGSFDAGCTDTNPCSNQQSAVHLAK